MEAGGSGGSSESQNQHNINQTLTAPIAKPNKSRKRDSSSRGGGDICDRESRDSQDDEENQEHVGGGDEVWQSFSEGFRQVQSVLDRNRILIQLVNENHRSKNAENMLKNVTLIQEINANISKIRDLYSDLSSDFSTFFHHRAASDKSD
uniref:Protein EARLY FLOWERING 4 domain-containing protein n=1 Tax=Kalanchoe fedtschenkoi TaxID=63787 RepID=A0A7N0UAR6_KALFE